MSVAAVQQAEVSLLMTTLTLAQWVMVKLVGPALHVADVFTILRASKDNWAEVTAEGIVF